MRSLLILLCLAISLHSLAQSKRTVVLLPNVNCISLDTSIVRPSTIQVIHGNAILKSGYRYSVHAQMLLRDTLLNDTLRVEYETLNIPYNAFLQSYQPQDGKRDVFQFGTIQAPQTERSYDAIQKSGSITRGVSLGNQQDLGVQSSLNLQLTGKIANRFQLLASISDNNIPVSSSGSTQQFQEFDQVFIQLTDKRNKIIAGDFTLPLRTHYFMKYTKRGLGLFVQNTSEFKSDGILKSEASVSISKGKFNRQSIQGIEGSQGPYRLQGAQGESYITVLGGTENVYIDGQKLVRGQDQDYWIDYNSAEIIFTPRNRITKDKRIVVEFQYSDRQYARPLITTDLEYTTSKGTTYVQFFQEMDAKNQPLQQTLTAEDRLTLMQAGDAFSSTNVSGIDSTGFQSDRVMYTLIDTLTFTNVLVYSTDATNAFYTASFTFVGNGNGNYVENGFSSYGKVFKWVAPVDGVKQGNYEPIQRLTAPKKQRMVVAGHTAHWGKETNYWTMNVEGAYTDFDANTFSNLNDQNNKGFACKVNLKEKIAGKKEGKVFLWEINSENLSSTFTRIERIREVEFERNWNVREIVRYGESEWLSEAKMMREFSPGKFISFSGARYEIGSVYEANRAKLLINANLTQRVKLQVDASALETEGVVNSSFLRQKAHLYREGKRFTVGVRDEQEQNTFANAQQSYKFFDGEAYFRSTDTTRRAFKLFVRNRTDHAFVLNEMTPISSANNYGVEFRNTTKGGSYFSVTASNRQLVSLNSLALIKPLSSLLGRIEFRSPQNKWAQLNLFYETSSGLEAKQAFIYAEVPAGQGVYVWNDYNDNGVKELSEFEVAAFAYEANYVRLPVQTTDYQSVYSTAFTSSLNLNPRQWKNKNSSLYNVLKVWSTQLMSRAERKSTYGGIEHISPLYTNDEFLVSAGNVFRGTLFYRKSDPNFSADLTSQKVMNKAFLLSGFETRVEQSFVVNFRKAMESSTQLLFSFTSGSKETSSDFLATRNFSSTYITATPSFAFQPTNNKRFSVLAEYGNRKGDASESKFQAQSLSVGADAQVEAKNGQLFKSEFKYIRIQFEGDATGPVVYDALGGLQAGNNLTLSCAWRKTINQNLQLSLNYKGRKSDGREIVHAGNMSVRLLFN
ncbi:MAG: hypothetical protein RLZZ71_414 [Bacteroidota bacterium]|jgi:hypothetical protein